MTETADAAVIGGDCYSRDRHAGLDRVEGLCQRVRQ
jgi:hypothetical protein